VNFIFIITTERDFLKLSHELKNNDEHNFI